MIPRVYVDGYDISDTVLFDTLQISRDSDTRIATAAFTMRQPAIVAKWDIAHWDVDKWSTGAAIRSKVIIYDVGVTPNVAKFGGYLSYFDYERPKPGEMFARVRCQDLASWLESIVIPSHDFGLASSDQAILTYAINTYAAGKLAATGIQQVLPVVPIGLVENWTLRQLFDWITDLSGAHWHVGPLGTVIYNAPSATPSAYILSDHPDNLTRYPFRMSSLSRDFARPLNEAIIIGAAQADGSNLRVVYRDPVSVSMWNLHSTTVLDRDITNANEALLRAESMVEQYAQPIVNGSLVCYTDRFTVGDWVKIESAEYTLNEPYELTSAEIKQLNPYETEYTFGFGPKPPDQQRLLRLLERFMRTESQAGVYSGVVAPGSITIDSLAPGFVLTADYIESVHADTIIGQIESHQINTVSAGSIIGTIEAHQINTVNAGSIEGVVSADNIGGVYATNIIGVIVSEQLVDGIIDQLSKFAQPIRPIPIIDTAPVLPNPDYPPGSYFHWKPNGHFYQINSTSSGWDDVGTNPDVLTGQMAFYTVGLVSVQNLNGLIISAQIDSIVAGKITGTLTSANVGRIDVSAMVGTLTVGNVAKIEVGALTGTLTALNAARIEVNTLTGTITAGSGVTINADVITGNITVGSGVHIEAGTITIGLIQNGQIQSISASKLTVGTIDATTINIINLNASNITTGTLTGRAVVINLNAVTTTIDNAPETGGSSTGVRGIKVSLNSTPTMASVVTEKFIRQTDGTGAFVHIGQQFAGFGVTAAQASPGTGQVSVQGGGVTLSGGATLIAAGVTAISSSGVWTGNGVNCPTSGIAGAGFNPNVGGTQYFGHSSASFTTADGKTVTVRGGAIVNVV